jgi:uncharacterized Zn-finger protein
MLSINIQTASQKKISCDFCGQRNLKTMASRLCNTSDFPFVCTRWKRRNSTPSIYLKVINNNRDRQRTREPVRHAKEAISKSSSQKPRKPQDRESTVSRIRYQDRDSRNNTEKESMDRKGGGFHKRGSQPASEYIHTYTYTHSMYMHMYVNFSGEPLVWLWRPSDNITDRFNTVDEVVVAFDQRH